MATNIGAMKSEIETPALLVDLQKAKRNIEKMNSFFRNYSAQLRPHVKSHKCPIIAHLQVQSGAKGITCAKLGEAEVMFQAGIQNILIANQIIQEKKIFRLAGLARQAEMTVAVDEMENINQLEKIMGLCNAKLGVLVEIDVGMNRCGVKTPQEAIELAQRIDASKNLLFQGLQGYEGHAVMIPELAKREKACRQVVNQLIQIKKAIEEAGISCPIISSGGTGTYHITGTFQGISEIQAGSYALMDSKYATIIEGFEQALTLLTTVISTRNQQRLIVDAGLKAITKEFGMPVVASIEGAVVSDLSEEHGTIECAKPSQLHVGDKIEMIPSHGCTTVNLHDIFHVLEENRLIGIWPIAARGKSD